MHKLLARQLKKHFGSVDEVPSELAGFVEAVDQAYEQADADRRLLERSLDLTSDELLEANAELRLDRRQLEQRVAERTAELRASELRFQTLADNSPTGIFHSDAGAARSTSTAPGARSPA